MLDLYVYLILFFVYFRLLKVLPFKEIIDILLEAESHHPKISSKDNSTRLIFKASFPLEEEQIPIFKNVLKEFGKPKKIKVHEERDCHGVIAEVKYSSQFQAYAAKIAMDGILFKGSGFVSTDIVVTKTGKKFDQFVRNRFRCIADNRSQGQEDILN